jgi:PAS domain S-box-containing protein
MLGIERKTLIGENITKFVTRPSQDDCYRHRQAVFYSDTKQSCVIRMKRPDDERLIVRLESIAFVAEQDQYCRMALIEITELNEAEAALNHLMTTLEQQVAERTWQLEKERNFIDTILQNQPALILVLDQNGCVVRVNKAFEIATGYCFKELYGNRIWMDLIPFVEREPIEKQIMEKLLSGWPVPIKHENSICHRDGSKRLFSWTNTVLTDLDGQVQYMIGIGIDITEQRRAEKDVRQHLEEVSRLQRLQTASELATVLAHEINQPLGAISMFAEASAQLLAHDPLDQDKLKKNLKQMSEQALRGGEIIRRLRAFMTHGKIESVPLNLNAVVNNACTLMIPQAQRNGIRVNLTLDNCLPLIMGAQVHLEQVLLNLMCNAIEAIHDAGMENGVIRIETRRERQWAMLSIHDSGPGIDATMTDKIFKGLYTTKNQGLGVGLRISRSLIEAHGGRLWAEPHTPHGLFHFQIPFAP